MAERPTERVAFWGWPEADDMEWVEFWGWSSGTAEAVTNVYSYSIPTVFQPRGPHSYQRRAADPPRKRYSTVIEHK